MVRDTSLFPSGFGEMLRVNFCSSAEPLPFILSATSQSQSSRPLSSQAVAEVKVTATASAPSAPTLTTASLVRITAGSEFTGS